MPVAAHLRIALFEGSGSAFVQCVYRNTGDTVVEIDRCGVADLPMGLGECRDLYVFLPRTPHAHLSKHGRPTARWADGRRIPIGWVEPELKTLAASCYTLMSESLDRSVTVGLLTNESYIDDRYAHDLVRGELAGMTASMRNDTPKALEPGGRYAANPVSFTISNYSWFDGARAWAEMEKEFMGVYSTPNDKAKGGPYWSTWYDFNFAQWDEVYFDEQMPRFLDLGIGTVEISSRWFNHVGDIDTNLNRFPQDNLREVVDRLHEANMLAYFWYVHWAVEDSSAYRRDNSPELFDRPVEIENKRGVAPGSRRRPELSVSSACAERYP